MPAREVQAHSLALRVVAREFQGVVPRLQRVADARRIDAVVGLREIGGELEVIGREGESAAVERHGFVENLLLGNAIVICSVAAEEIDGGGKILEVNWLGRAEFDGLLVAEEGVRHGTVVTVEVGEIVPRRGIFRIQIAGREVLRGGLVLAAQVVEEAAESEASLGVSGISL